MSRAPISASITWRSASALHLPVERVRAGAAAAGLTGRIDWLGSLAQEKVLEQYRAADLFVLPTRELEGFGLVAIEAMACGTPAMGTPIGAIPEVLGAVDMLFKEPTAESIEEGIRRFFTENPDEVSWKCWEHVSRHHDWQKEIVRVEELLEKVVDESRRHGRP